MKLLTPKQVREEKRKEAAKDLVLAQKVQDVSKVKRLELNTIKSEFADKKQKVESEFYAFKSKIETKKNTLTNEVVQLEKRKEEALKPIGS